VPEWRLWAAGTIVVLAVAGGVAPARSQVLDRPNTPPDVTAFGTTAVWSARSTDDGLFRLTAWQDGQLSTLPVAPSERPLADVDLGPGPDGGVWAVYSRCDAPEGAAGACDLYRFDFATRDEARLDAVSAPGIDEHAPTIWGDRIAFARRPPSVAVGRPAERAFIARVDGSTPPEGLPMYGPRDVPRDHLRDFSITGLDLQGDELALSWQAYCCNAVTWGPAEGPRRRAFFGEHYGQHGDIGLSPTLRGRSLVYGVYSRDYAYQAAAAYRVDTRTGLHEVLALPPSLSGLAQFGERSLLATFGSWYYEHPCPRCTVELLSSPRWKSHRPARR
jgi:hypothetical protein